MNRVDNYKKTYILGISFLIIISVAFWIISPIGMDFELNALRIGELARELVRSGASFPVYMFKDVYNHYGYPIPIFYGSISLLPFALLVAMGMSVFSAYKLMIISVLWLSFGSAYLCLKSFFKDRDAETGLIFFGAFVYASQPFFLIELFVRSANSGGMVFVFIPPVLLGFYLLTRTEEVLRGILLLGGGMAGIVTSHVTSTVIVVTALAVVYLAGLRSMDRRLIRTARIIIAAAVCFLLSAWYLLPMLEQLMTDEYIGSAVHSLMIPRENILALLVPMHLGILLSKVLHRSLALSMIGGAVISMIATVIYLWRHGYVLKLRRDGDSSEADTSSDHIRRMWKLIAIYFCFVAVLLIHWTFIERYIAFMQFAWRIFMVAAVIEVAVCILPLMQDAESARKFVRFRVNLAIMVGIYVLMFFFGFHTVKNLFPEIIGSISGHEVTSYEYSYESETPDELYLPVSVDKQAIFENERTVTVVQSDEALSATDVRYTYDIDEEAATVTVYVTDDAHGNIQMECPFIMYRGYSATDVDTGLALDVSEGDNGLVCIDVPAGYTGTFTVSYTGTLIQRISYFVSLFAAVLFILAAGLLIWRRAGQERTP